MLATQTRHGLLGILVIVSAALALLAPSFASARPLKLGLAEPGYRSVDPNMREQLFDRTVEAGAEIVRLNAFWSEIDPGGSPPADPANPANPRYRFRILDDAVRLAHARGLQVLITIQRAPTWAEGDDRPAHDPDDRTTRPGIWKPDPRAFADFVGAVAGRYSGTFPDPRDPTRALPDVKLWQLWNEPNLGAFLGPQRIDGSPAAARLYRPLLNRGYAAVKRVDPRDKVIIAGTAPLSSTHTRTGPTTFLRQLLCLTRKLKPRRRCPGKARFDIFDHHAITPRNPRNGGDGDGVRLADYHRLTRILRAAERHRTVRPAKLRRPLWTTEVYWETNPPDPATGVEPRLAARWLQEGIRMLHRQNVEVVLNFFLRDLAMTSPGEVGNVQGGLLFRDLSKKPSFDAFRFPFVVERRSRKRVEVWARAPAKGRLLIQRRAGNRWRKIHAQRVRAGRVVSRRVRLPRRKRGRYVLRAKLAGQPSLKYRSR